jgi:hypothetical protein
VPGLAGPEKAARGETPADVWWHTVIPTSGKEKTGCPARSRTQTSRQGGTIAAATDALETAKEPFDAGPVRPALPVRARCGGCKRLGQ